MKENKEIIHVVLWLLSNVLFVLKIEMICDSKMVSVCVSIIKYQVKKERDVVNTFNIAALKMYLILKLIDLCT